MLPAVEDMWHIYNLVRKGDTVTAKTFRKVTSLSADGSGNSERVSIKLTVNVEVTDFDPIGEALNSPQPSRNDWTHNGAFSFNEGIVMQGKRSAYAAAMWRTRSL